MEAGKDIIPGEWVYDTAAAKNRPLSNAAQHAVNILRKKWSRMSYRQRKAIGREYYRLSHGIAEITAKIRTRERKQADKDITKLTDDLSDEKDPCKGAFAAFMRR